MKERYYVIRATEDGPSIQEMDGGTLEKRLNEGYYGEGEHAPKWGESVPNFDYGEGAIIVRGTPVVPKPIDVVRQWGLP